MLNNIRQNRTRFKLKKVTNRKRLTVFRSNNHIYAQLIDDNSSTTITSASSMDKSLKLDAKTKVDQAKAVGKLIATNAKEKGIKTVVFDRGGFLYHGRVKALAESARESGLKF